MLDGRNILVVEDEAVIAFDLAQALADVGAKVHMAGTLREAMALIELNWCAAVLDHRLGTETSDNIYIELRKRKVPFIVVSGHPPALIALSDVLVLSKPVIPRRVVRILAAMLDIRDNTLISGMRPPAQ